MVAKNVPSLDPGTLLLLAKYLASAGTPDETTFLRGDRTWAAPPVGGDVVGPGSSVEHRLAAFADTAGKLLEDSGLTLADLATAAQGVKADGAAQKSANLSDLTNAATARGNLGLGSAATKATGTDAGDIPLLGAGGLIDTARLGTGTANTSTYLRGDGTWAAAGGDAGSPGAWTAFSSFGANVSAHDGSVYYTPRCRISADGTKVELRGAVVVSMTIGVNNTMFTLPTGFRPASRVGLSGTTNASATSSIARFYIGSDGVAAGLATVSAATVALDGLSFALS